jgi:hypothetical protein
MQVTFAGLGAAAATGWMWLAVRAREIVRRPEQMALVCGVGRSVSMKLFFDPHASIDTKEMVSYMSYDQWSCICA